MRHTWGAFPFVGLCKPVGAGRAHAAEPQFDTAPRPQKQKTYSTVTDFARFLGLSMSRPSANAVW